MKPIDIRTASEHLRLILSAVAVCTIIRPLRVQHDLGKENQGVVTNRNYDSRV
jgi:hypothetical protein